ncbi:MAG: hypothetical protein WAW90_01345 [Minisyncoccia bacterium]
MSKLKIALEYLDNRPIITGLFTVLFTVVIGISIACVTGLINPAQVYAQVIGPPCCGGNPVPVPPPVIGPPCCTVVPPPVVPPPVVPPPVVPPPIIPPPIVPPPAPTCSLTANPASVQTGSPSTLTWTTANATTFSIDQGIGAVAPVAGGSQSVTPAATITYTGTATGLGGSVTCAATVTVTVVPPPPIVCVVNCGGGGGGGGGGGSLPPVVTLATLSHIGAAQPLAYLYLSQIPYTGLDLGPVGTATYWLVLIVGSLVLTYIVIFYIAPIAQRAMRDFSVHVSTMLEKSSRPAVSMPIIQHFVTVPNKPSVSSVPVSEPEALEQSHGYSSYDGFKSFSRNGALSIDDIVKGLSREHAPQSVQQAASSTSSVMNTEPIYEKVEPIFVEEELKMSSSTEEVSTDARGLASALIEGDRVAVFATLRQFVLSGGVPEKLISSVVFLIDDTYRARLDGSHCDATMARLTARLDTTTLEKLVAALATAIDASYTDKVTGAKLAFTRALAVLGA